MASLVLSDSSQLTDDGFEKLPDQIMYPYAEPYDLQKHDICGVICAILTWLLILYAEFVVMVVMLLPCPYPVYSAVNMIIFQTFASLAFASHLRAMFTDPGAVPKGNATKEMIQQMGFREGQVIFKCPKCCSIKPERAHHCSVCQRSRPMPRVIFHSYLNAESVMDVQKLSAIWVSMFQFYIAMISIHSLILSVNQLIMCTNHEWKDCSAYSPPATVVLLLFLVFEGLLFATFTMVMLGTQLQAIWNDETGIEQLKKEEARWVKKSRWKSIQAVFGRFSLAWFSPFTRPPPKTKLESYLYSV
nr:unnamed protein product [Timema californicum]